MQVIIGYFNAKAGCENAEHDRTMGCFRNNDSRERFIDFSTQEDTLVNLGFIQSKN